MKHEERAKELIKQARRELVMSSSYLEDIQDQFVELAEYAQKKQIHETKFNIWMMIERLQGAVNYLEDADEHAAKTDNYEVVLFPGTDKAKLYSVHFTLSGAGKYSEYIAQEEMCEEGANPDVTVNGSTDY